MWKDVGPSDRHLYEGAVICWEVLIRSTSVVIHSLEIEIRAAGFLKKQ
jgi:hypothetical protein